MGNVLAGTGYGCSLPAMVKLWRRVWQAAPDALFGVATLAAGGSEGNGQHMAGMRWSETANYGTLPSPSMPHAFVAQVYGKENWGVGMPCSHLRVRAARHTGTHAVLPRRQQAGVAQALHTPRSAASRVGYHLTRADGCGVVAPSPHAQIWATPGQQKRKAG